MRTTRRQRQHPTMGDVTATLTQRDVGQDAPLVQPNRPPKGWETRQIQREQQAAAAAALLGQMSAHLGDIKTLMLAPPSADVLLQGAYSVSPAGGLSGPFERSWKTVFQAVTITNFGRTATAMLYVMSSPLSNNAAPTVGAGVARVPPGIERTIVMRGTSLSIQAAVNTHFDLVVFSRPREPRSGLSVNPIT